MSNLVISHAALGRRALVSGLGLTTRWSTEAVRLALLGADNSHCPWEWSREGIQRVYRPLGISIDDEDCDEDLAIPDNHHVVIFGPHPSTNALFGWVHELLWRFNPRPLAPVIKTGHRWNPFAGWGLYAIGGVPLARTNTDRDIAVLRQQLAKLQDRPSLVNIFPDAHRAFPNLVEANQQELLGRAFWKDEEDYRELLLELSRALRWTLSPRPTGLLTILDHLPGPFTAFECVAHFNRDAPSVFEADRLVGSQLTFRLRRVELPREREALKRELFRRWIEINGYISRKMAVKAAV